MPTTHHNQPFSLRPVTLADLPEAIKMFNACARETSGRDEFDLQEYEREWRDPTINLATDTRIAQTPDGKIVGCIEVWNSSPFVQVWIWGLVHPEFRGQGIGTAMMAWAEDRACAAIDKAPAGTRVYMASGADSTRQPAIELLTDRGFRAVRHSLTMERSLESAPPAPALPAGITIRTMRPGEELAVYRATDEAFRDHWGVVARPEEQGFALFQHRALGHDNFDPSLWFLAMDGDQIAGISLCQKQRTGYPDQGWVDTLGVRRPWRKRGLALALLYHSFAELRARGRTSVGLGVDAQSLTGATRLYERAGMHSTRQYTTFERDLRPGTDLTTREVE
jgi:mycothiol synthase